MNPAVISESNEAGDERAELVDRILRSRHFHKATRLRAFFTYVSGRALQEPGVEIHEHEIASNVFGRDFDPRAGDDTLVRVQASQLRKRLDRYFATDGLGERWRIEIPMGNYAPLFREAPGLAVEPAPPPSIPRRRRWPALAVVAGMVLCGALAWIGLRAWLVPRPAPSYLRLLWSGLFVEGQATDVVLADSNLAIVGDVVENPINAADYSERRYWAQIEKLPDPALRKIIQRTMSRRYTSFTDAVMSHRILAAGGNLPGARITFSRDFQVRTLQTGNVVFLGSKRSNPWIELVEGPLNFRISTGKGNKVVENRSPRPGELPLYGVVEGGPALPYQGYCQICYLPNLARTGNILIVGGTEAEATEAGGEFVLSEKWLERLHKEAGLKPGEPFPAFEVLLRTMRVDGSPVRVEIVATRFPSLAVSRAGAGASR